MDSIWRLILRGAGCLTGLGYVSSRRVDHRAAQLLTTSPTDESSAHCWAKLCGYRGGGVVSHTLSTMIPRLWELSGSFPTDFSAAGGA